MASRPLLMIPGPVEVSPAVREAYSVDPPGHLSPAFIESFGRTLERMREVWMAPAGAQPFVLAGSGTLAMDMAIWNVLGPGDRAVLVNTGYFSDRLAEMARRRGVEVQQVGAAPGDAPDIAAVEAALANSPRALLATHVDTSTGVRVDARALAELARRHGVLSIFDGVCGTAAERFEMGAWGADVYFTASQKAIGLPPGLALMVASPRALEAREKLAAPPPLSIDWLAWQPVMAAYEARKPAYFATPATSLVRALDEGLGEILATRSGGRDGMDARFAVHEAAASAMRAGFAALGLTLLPTRRELAANTLSALRYPAGVDASLLPRITARGVVVAGGLYPGLQASYFRVGHMGWTVTQPDLLRRALEAIAAALAEAGHGPGPSAALEAFDGAIPAAV